MTNKLICPTCDGLGQERREVTHPAQDVYGWHSEGYPSRFYRRTCKHCGGDGFVDPPRHSVPLVPRKNAAAMTPLKWDVLPELVPGMRGWGAEDARMSFGISFDHKHPTLGYRASWYDGARINYVEPASATLDEAKQALENVRRQHCH